MKITWLGHAGFRIEIGAEVLLVDPWLRGNPAFDENRFDEAVDGSTAILLTHAHFDHAATVGEVAKATGTKVHGIFDLVGWLGEREGFEGVGFNKGGTVMIGEVAVTMVHATHSSTMTVDGVPIAPGSECGFVIAGEGRTIYLAGDTDVHSDMALIRELHEPDIGILPIGGHFTMDSKRAAFACRKFFAFETVIPSHYATFPLLEQSADAFREAVAPTKVVAPAVMEPVSL